jgi:glycosyltransferase involved in cell wall biosynthesis
MRHPRIYTQMVSSVGTHGAILMTAGYMATALRLGGYRAPIVAVEHGSVLELLARPRALQCAARVDLALGARAIDAQVAVSEFMLGKLRRVPHSRDTGTIPNGVDIDEFRLRRPIFETERRPLVGWAGRMVPGKGVDDLLHATASKGEPSFDVQLAGDGPERPRLEQLVESLGISSRVRFVGRRHDMSAFWNECDLAAATSSTFIESFGMAPLEAGACGRPVVATRNGGFPDIVIDGITGRLVDSGDRAGIAGALLSYTRDPTMARRHGATARDRAAEHFGIRVCADSYIRLLRKCGAQL